MGESSISSEYGRIQRAPVPFGEVLSCIVAVDRDVVALQCHAVGSTGGQDGFQGAAQVADAVRGGIVGVIGERIKNWPPEQGIPVGGGCGQVGVVDRDDHQLRVQHEVR